MKLIRKFPNFKKFVIGMKENVILKSETFYYFGDVGGRGETVTTVAGIYLVMKTLKEQNPDARFEILEGERYE